MSDPRILGLALMAVAILTFLGTTSEALPPEAFFPALVLFAIGAIQFLRTNHRAMTDAEERVERSADPVMRENRMARLLADRQTATTPFGLSRQAAPKDGSGHAAPSDFGARLEPIEIDLDEEDGDEYSTRVTTDVSFPIEVQRGDALAEQLGKLNRLRERRVLSEEEYAMAKSKLLD